MQSMGLNDQKLGRATLPLVMKWGERGGVASKCLYRHLFLLRTNLAEVETQGSLDEALSSIGQQKEKVDNII